MKIIIYTVLLLVSTSLNAKYLDTKSCKECHDMIHYEHTTSMHHKSSIFKNELHKKIKAKVSPDKYGCALCHTPGASNLRALMTGEEQPSAKSTEQLDGVSCFYCHQITKVLELKHKNINFYSNKKSEKPTFLAALDKPDTSDKHKSKSNDIYKNSQVCMGCHGKKYNSNKVIICNGYNEFNKTSDCIKCHMPKNPGGTTKLNKRGRTQYASHEFLGIRSNTMVKKAVELYIAASKNSDMLEITITNKMGHSIIMQPMRLKYIKTTIERSGKIIWSNFKTDPMEDKEATFTILFKDKDNKQSTPAIAKGFKFNNNLKANSTKTIKYNIPKLQIGDIITSAWISYVVRPSLASKLGLENEYTKEYKGVSKILEIK
ncbi:MAG: hypothetical protein HOH31_01155 [Campylobacteraceae bacterium]|nr:hypothetical protein [Campylobacteraceae bacterium]